MREKHSSYYILALISVKNRIDTWSFFYLTKEFISSWWYILFSVLFLCCCSNLRNMGHSQLTVYALGFKKIWSDLFLPLDTGPARLQRVSVDWGLAKKFCPITQALSSTFFPCCFLLTKMPIETVEDDEWNTLRLPGGASVVVVPCTLTHSHTHTHTHTHTYSGWMDVHYLSWITLSRISKEKNRGSVIFRNWLQVRWSKEKKSCRDEKLGHMNIMAEVEFSVILI